MKIKMDQIYRRNHSKRPFDERLKRAIILTIKCVLLLVIPSLSAVAGAAIWYFGFWRTGMHFNVAMENIVSSGWIPFFCVMYCLLTTQVFNTVWIEYKAFRMAVKRYNIHEFMDLRDEEMSPLVHMVLWILSLIVLVSFMTVNYPTIMGGVIVTSLTTFVLVLIFVVTMEIDDPCHGLWYIKNIPPEWMDIDVKEWRRKHQDRRRIEFKEQLDEVGISIRADSANGKGVVDITIESAGKKR